MTLSGFILAFKALEKETKGKCFYCGVQTRRGSLHPTDEIFQTKDHVVPIAVKGWTAPWNRVVCCYGCNTAKGCLTLSEFKKCSGIGEFYAESLLGFSIESLEDIAALSFMVETERNTGGRRVDLRAKPRIRVA